KRVEALFSDYLETLKATTSESNWKPIYYRYKKWIEPEIGIMKIEKLTEQHLQNIINNAFAAKRSKKYLMNIRVDLIAFIKFCRKKRVTSFIPEDITIPKSAPVKEKHILQPEDIIRLFSCNETLFKGKPKEDALINAYRFQVLTGLRPGELLALEWSDVVNKRVYINRAVNSLGHITEGKNQNAKRYFALSDSTEAVLFEQYKLNSNGRIFGNIAQEEYRNCWKRYAKHNELPNITPYEIRHTFVSIASSLPLGEIKALVGHSQSMDTLGIYSHEVNGALENTASKIDDIFKDILAVSQSGLK
ncbi:MAG: site-specific integrase, partial [Oscillospiraceae bacterium]